MTSASIGAGLVLHVAGTGGSAEIALPAGTPLVATYDVLRLGEAQLWQIDRSKGLPGAAYRPLSVSDGEQAQMQARFPPSFTQIGVRGELALALELYSWNDEDETPCIDREDLRVSRVTVAPGSIHVDGKLLLRRGRHRYWVAEGGRKFSDWLIETPRVPASMSR